MKFLNKPIDIIEVSRLLEDEIFEYWIEPKYIVGFNKDELKKHAEKRFLERHDNLDFERALDIDEIITEYLIGCLSKDAFLNLEKEVKFLNCNNVIDAARYMINELGSSTVCYNYTTFSRYLINGSNVNNIFKEIYKYFEEENNTHLKNIWRIFNIELLAYNLNDLSDINMVSYNSMVNFKSKNTCMY